MKIRVKAIKNWYLTGSILIIFLSSFCYSTTGIKESFITISVSEAKELVDNDEELFVLDVRNPYEFEAGHILGAYLIPVNDIFARKDELPKNTSTSILVYCQSGYRSATASDTLDSLGYTQVKNMAYGFSAWIDAGYPYETGPFIKPTTSLSMNTTHSSSEDQTSSSSEHSTVTPSLELTLGVIGLLFFLAIKKRK